MKNTKEHNKDVLDNLDTPKERGAGVSCDDCGEEMNFSDNRILTSNPPQARVHCPKCDFSTNIFIEN